MKQGTPLLFSTPTQNKVRGEVIGKTANRSFVQVQDTVGRVAIIHNRIDVICTL